MDWNERSSFLVQPRSFSEPLSLRDFRLLQRSPSPFLYIKEPDFMFVDDSSHVGIVGTLIEPNRHPKPKAALCWPFYLFYHSLHGPVGTTPLKVEYNPCKTKKVKKHVKKIMILWLMYVQKNCDSLQERQGQVSFHYSQDCSLFCQH